MCAYRPAAWEARLPADQVLGLPALAQGLIADVSTKLASYDHALVADIPITALPGYHVLLSIYLSQELYYARVYRFWIESIFDVLAP